MSKAQLQGVRFEFYGRTVYGKVESRNQLDLHLCGHGMDTDDVQEALQVVTWLEEHGSVAERPATCSECSACNLGCFTVQREESLRSQLDQLMRAVSDATHTSGNKVELTFMHADKQYIFSAAWLYLRGSMGIPGDYYLSNVWTYFAQNPTEQLLAKIRDVPGVLRVSTEVVKDTDTQAFDIHTSSSRHTSLEDCLVAVTNVLAS